MCNCYTCNLCSHSSKGYYYFNQVLKKSVNAVEEVANEICNNTNLIPYPTDVEKEGDILIKVLMVKILQELKLS